MAQNFDLLSLPDDALIAVLFHLGFKDVLRIGATCRVLRGVSLSDCVWMSFCSCWEKDVNVKEWRAGVDSGLALFRLLRSFDRIVGPWTARELAPRGGLLYVTWGDLSLVACRILAMQAGELKLRRLFEVVGLRDGSFKVELFTTYTSSIGLTDVRLPGALVWSSRGEPEFFLELNGLYDTYKSAKAEPSSLGNIIGGLPHEADDSSSLAQLLQLDQEERIQDDQAQRQSATRRAAGGELGLLRAESEGVYQQVNAERRVDIIQRLLRHRFALDDDYQRGGEHRDLSLGHRTLQYLIRLASSGGSRVATDEHVPGGNYGNRGESSMERGPIVRSLYGRLTVEEPEAGKELVGLWSGIYGPHGVEIINVTYTDEEIVGTKVLGDPNVPCGQMSFKVRLSMENVQIPVELQRIVDFHTGLDFRIVKSFKGYGRIAGHNFQNPRWVPGQLLVDRRGQIAFLWEDVNFVVPFHKLNLASFYQAQKIVQGIL